MEFGFKYQAYVRQSLAPLAMPLLAAVLVVLGGRFFVLSHGTFATLLLSASVVVVSWLAWVCCGIDSTRRNSYRRIVSAALNKKVAHSSA
jgi:hypothetical protein